MRSSLIGLILGTVIIIGTVLKTTDDHLIYLNIMAFLIVFGGTISVGIITYGLKEVFTIFKVYFSVFTTTSKKDVQIVSELTVITKQIHAQKNSILKIKESSELHPFIKDGLAMIENNFTLEQVKNTLTRMVIERQNHYDEKIEMLTTISKYPPAFGMMGTVIGLVAVLQKLSSFKEVSDLGPSMAIALVTTLYGLFLANYLFNPIADNLQGRSNHDIKIRRIIIEGICLIHQEEDPIYVEEVLKAYLMPIDRLEVENTLTTSKVA